MTKLEPIMNRVVLKQLNRKESKGGLLLAHEAQKSADRAEVLAVGPGMLDLYTGKNVPCSLQVGDQVLINAYLGMKVSINLTDQDGKERLEEVIIQKEEEILCKEIEDNG